MAVYWDPLLGWVDSESTTTGTTMSTEYFNLTDRVVAHPNFNLIDRVVAHPNYPEEEIPIPEREELVSEEAEKVDIYSDAGINLWMTRQGVLMDIPDMESDHIKNCIRMLGRWLTHPADNRQSYFLKQKIAKFREVLTARGEDILW